MIETALAAAVMIFGVAGSLASLLQLRRIRRRKSSALILVDAHGAVTIFATLAVALRFRDRHRWRPSLRRPGPRSRRAHSVSV